jgi:hypothetical protein
MSNLIFTTGLGQVQQQDLDWTAVVMCVLLEKSTSTYSPDKDHDFLSSFTGGGGVEITAASYARRTLTGCSLNINKTDDQVEFKCNNIAFGSLEAGEVVKSMIVYRQIGGDDGTPEDDVMFLYIDTDIGGILPASLGGGAFNITVPSAGLVKVAQP